MVPAGISFLTGVAMVQLFAELRLSSSAAWAALAGVVLLLVLSRNCRRRVKLLVISCLWLLAGMLWATLSALSYLEQRLPEAMAGKDIELIGVIEDIPQRYQGVQRFTFSVRRYTSGVDATLLPGKLRLSWYYGEDVNAGETWRFVVRLKPPHGFLNPGGFDYEAWLYQKGIHATGYVRKNPANWRLAEAGALSIDALRQSLSARIQHALAHSELAGLITALAVGDRSPITPQQWDRLINTGTNHLMAISGLHIGLAAGFAYWVTRRAMPARLMKKQPAQRVATVAGLALAGVYALLAGLSIPTQRALVMLACAAFAFTASRNIRALDVLAAALLAVLVFDPTAVLAAGFWFSFLAVGAIYYVFSGRIGRRSRWRQWGLMQVAIALLLFPLSLLMFQQASLVSPLANFFLVPFVSLLVVPLVLLSVLLMPLFDGLALLLLDIATGLLELAWPLLVALSDLPFAYGSRAASDLVAAGLAMAGVLLLLAPRGIPARWLGLALVIPVLTGSPQRPAQGAFVLDLLDVGQGLAAVVRTAEHTLVFDSGARFSEKMDAGDAVIAPFLRQLSVRHIDRIVISHGDNDHIGGAGSLIAAFPAAELVGQDIGQLSAGKRSACRSHQKWAWDGVEFEFLHPDDTFYAERNNRSCVLKISGPGGRLLLTGDIEKKIEMRLLRSRGDELRAEVLVVPHHGSNSSSSSAFIRAVAPEIALFPVGYRNRYRLPSSAVVARYRRAGARLYASGISGAIRLKFDPGDGVEVVSEYRHTHGKYWNHSVLPQWK